MPLVASVILLWASAADSQPVFRSDVELVQIEASVVDSNGAPVLGLTAADFDVRESGKLREILSFEPIVVSVPAVPADRSPTLRPRTFAPRDGRYLMVFFDDVHITPPVAERARVQLRRLLSEDLQEGDWVTLVAPGADFWWNARTRAERELLAPAVSRLSGLLARDPFKRGISDFGAMRIVEYGIGPHQLNVDAEIQYLVARRGVKRSVGALQKAIQALEGFRGKKTVFVVSDGFIRAPHVNEYDGVIDAARRAGVTLHFALASGLGSGLAGADGGSSCGSPMCLETEAGGTTYLAVATGGTASLSNDLTVLARQALREGSAYYVLGFQPAPGSRHQRRRLSVGVHRTGATVHARREYFFDPKHDDANSTPWPHSRFVSDATSMPVTAALRFEGESDSAVLTTLDMCIGSGSVRAPAAVVLSAELVPLRGGRPLFDTDASPVQLSDGVLSRTWRLAPGLWQARVALRDPSTSASASVQTTFEVPQQYQLGSTAR